MLSAFAGASGTKLRAAGLYRHGLQGLTLMRALRRALAAACLIVSVIAGGNAMAASGDLLDAIEYYYQKLDHYFVTADPHEISALDAGMFPGWQRTGFSFKVLDPSTAVANVSPVCRFYGIPAAGLDSHFYSASAAPIPTIVTLQIPRCNSR